VHSTAPLVDNCALIIARRCTSLCFVGSRVLICKFHRLQAWNRRLSTVQNKDIILKQSVLLITLRFLASVPQ